MTKHVLTVYAATADVEKDEILNLLTARLSTALRWGIHHAHVHAEAAKVGAR